MDEVEVDITWETVMDGCVGKDVPLRRPMAHDKIIESWWVPGSPVAFPNRTVGLSVKCKIQGDVIALVSLSEFGCSDLTRARRENRWLHGRDWGGRSRGLVCCSGPRSNRRPDVRESRSSSHMAERLGESRTTLWRDKEGEDVVGTTNIVATCQIPNADNRSIDQS